MNCTWFLQVHDSCRNDQALVQEARKDDSAECCTSICCMQLPWKWLQHCLFRWHSEKDCSNACFASTVGKTAPLLVSLASGSKWFLFVVLEVEWVQFVLKENGGEHGNSGCCTNLLRVVCLRSVECWLYLRLTDCIFRLSRMEENMRALDAALPLDAWTILCGLDRGYRYDFPCCHSVRLG